jgi:tRNA U34 5-methylaminomethyl-2-thiouridine-forming methyltransferase MnmC
MTGTPVSARFDDPYYTDGAGLAEARHVFLSGNDLPARLCDGFHVAELGFGTGLNLLALLDAWQGPGRLRFTSFEAFPFRPRRWRARSPRSPAAGPGAGRAWAQATGPVRRLDLPGARVEVHLGDARALLPGWEGRADAWFLDGFAPARNPELWEPELHARGRAPHRAGRHLRDLYRRGRGAAGAGGGRFRG